MHAVGRAHQAASHALAWSVLCGLGLLIVPSLAGQTQPTPRSPKTAKAAASAANVPVGPRDYASRNFVLHTDLAPNEAQELLKRLETMLTQVSRYWNQANTQPIEMYVVKDLQAWPSGIFPEPAAESLKRGGGLTMSVTQSLLNPATGRKAGRLGTKAVVYAVADRGTPQHEAVHAYCAQMFGTTGPTWFAEGIAELGQYWRDKDLSVQIHPEVLRHLKESPPQPLAQIVDRQQQTGDSWQNYAYRWALCHLLAFNPNYADRFRPLGLQLLNEGPASFESVYGPLAPEIAFEYQFFLEHIEQGFRVDLCRWDWKTKPQSLRASASVVSKIDAGRGWQASRALVEQDTSYQIGCEGTWTVDETTRNVPAAGNDAGRGRLIGVLYADYKLSEPFPLGGQERWTAPASGALFLRCEDDWSKIADNTGTISVRIQRAE